MATYLVTGGAGFIGSAVVRQIIAETSDTVVNVDLLTYAGNLDSLDTAKNHPRHRFHQVDICNSDAVKSLLREYQPETILHLAAESHVDRSIDGPAAFVQANLVGTFSMLQAAREYWAALPPAAASSFRFVHVSTDEVFGSLGAEGKFTESTPYDPSSPYSATKAGADHLARAWQRTFGLPVAVTNCSNNYGPYQFPEKLIPLMVRKAASAESMPVYGRGENVRDWLFVEDHARALRLVAQRGIPGETYNIGGDCERQNIEVVRKICSLMDELRPDPAGSHERLITPVQDRPGHDHRYAIDASKIRRQLGWKPEQTFETGLRLTVEWYLSHDEWLDNITSGKYRGERLGVTIGAA